MFARRRLALLTVLGLLLVGGCGTPPWREARPTTSPTSSVSPSRTPSSTPSAAHNDLAKGSLKRTLTAGNVRLNANYYSTLSMTDWTPAASKPLTVSVVGSFTDRSKQNIYLSRLTMNLDVGGAEGPLPAPAPIIDEAAVFPGYVITAPTSYGQVFTLPGLDPAARSITVSLTYELLVQVAPKSRQNPHKKVGALNYGFSLIPEADYLLGVDGDTTLARDCVERLEEEIVSDTRIGGISAVYSIDDRGFKGLVAPLLIAGQRAQFAAFNMQNMLRGRNMAVLGGQCSIFSMRSLRDVMVANRQSTPWVSDSEVEDSLLSLQIKSAGYLTKISARARANVGGMTTLRSLDGQQVKWNYGALDLMWPGQRGDTKGQPFHPNLRLRWAENLGMLTNIFTRIAFVLLLAAALSIDAFVFSPVWLIPPVVAILLNLRIACSMRYRTWRDIMFAAAGCRPRSTCGCGPATSYGRGRSSCPAYRPTTGPLRPRRSVARATPIWCRWPWCW